MPTRRTLQINKKKKKKKTKAINKINKYKTNYQQQIFIYFPFLSFLIEFETYSYLHPFFVVH